MVKNISDKFSRLIRVKNPNNENVEIIIVSESYAIEKEIIFDLNYREPNKC